MVSIDRNKRNDFFKGHFASLVGHRRDPGELAERYLSIGTNGNGFFKRHSASPVGHRRGFLSIVTSYLCAVRLFGHVCQ